MILAGSYSPGVVVRGRREECAVLDRLLDGARAGRSGALLLEGEAGVGKTALLGYAIASASDLRVLRAAGVESEMELPFAALQQLCVPVLDQLERLADPQREALAVAFGLRKGSAPDRFLVGLAVLSLLSEVAEEHPVLCVLDDAHWLDWASAHGLAFVARRLLAEGVVMLVAARKPGEVFAGLPALVIEGLENGDARELLRSAVPGPLTERLEGQLIEETRGNPLALLELPRGLSWARLAAGFGLLGAASLSGRIEESYRDQLQVLPVDTQRLLVIAAADPTGDPALLRHAAAGLGIASEAIEPATDAGLIEVDSRLRFRHPLVRSAVYRAAPLRERRSAHRSLAQATDAELDPDRRAWHLAEATTGTDEDVATELERAADRAQARGGFAAAAAFLERAAALTPEPSRRAQRALAAAQTKVRAGALDDALGLLATAETGGLSGLERARVGLLRAQIAFVMQRGGDAALMLLEAAQQLADLDPALSRETYLEALAAAGFAGRLADPGASALEVAQAARAAPAAPHPPRGIDLLLEGFVTLFTNCYDAAVPILQQALNAFSADMPVAEQLRWGWLATVASVHLWDDERWGTLSERHVRLARETGALTDLQLALSQRISFHLFAGELPTAASLVDELQAATNATGTKLAPYGAAGLLALRGTETEAAQLITSSREDVQQRGEGIGISALEWAEAVLNNGLRRYEDACTAALRIAEYPHDLAPPNWHLTELIEAAVRAQKPELAADARRRLVEMTRASGTDWALGIAARSEALLTDGDSSEGAYVEAISRLGRTRITVDFARAHLVYGEWLRRGRRRKEASEYLRTALEMLTAMGVEAFARRAERELLATGEHVRKRTVETRDDLTAQEAQIAHLARDGLSNPEIATRLFISRHTVHYHLSKVFLKLGISARTELQTALPQESDTSTSPSPPVAPAARGDN